MLNNAIVLYDRIDRIELGEQGASYIFCSGEKILRAGCPRAYPTALRDYTSLPFFSTHLTTFYYSTMYDLLPYYTISLTSTIFLYPLSFALLNAFLLAILGDGLQEISLSP